MDPILAVFLLAIYVAPTLIALGRRTSMLVLVCVLNVLLGWTIVGWFVSLALAVLLPYHRAAQPISSGNRGAVRPVAAAYGGVTSAPQKREFLMSPVRAAVLSMLAPVIYQYWWFWRFFVFARKEGFPRARSFWWIFVPFYGWAIIGRLFRDLEDGLGSSRPKEFDAQVALALVVAGHVAAGWSTRLPLPFALVAIAVSIIFIAVAIYQVQLAANTYLCLKYPGSRGAGVIPAELMAAAAGMLLITILYLEAGPNVSAGSTPTNGLNLTMPSPTLPTQPAPTPSFKPSPGGPWYGTGVWRLTSEPGDYILQGRSLAIASPSWRFLAAQYGGPGSIEINADSSDGHWSVILVVPHGQLLHPGTYQNAERSPSRPSSAPGIQVTGENRACNQAYGSFTITTVTFDAQGRLVDFDASFEQSCEARTAPPLRGSVRFSADPAA